MDFLKRAKVFRLKCSGQSKYLIADKDDETIQQSRNRSSKKAEWVYEHVEGKPNLIRLRNCSNYRYLAATQDLFLLGMTGKRVEQTIRMGSTIEWEPIREGLYIKLKSHTGTLLRANRGPPPWRNSVTHDQPGHWTSTENMTLWIVDIVEFHLQSLGNGNENADSNTFMEQHQGTSTDASLSCTATDQEAYFSPKQSFNENRPATDQASAAQSKNLSHASSEKSTPVSTFVQHHLCHESQHSDSFDKLKSMLSGLQDLLDETQETDTKSEAGSEFSAEQGLTSHQPHQLEVKMAKQTLKELQHMDFNTLLSSGRDKKLEKSINIVVADANVSFNGQIPKELSNLQDQIKSMRNDHNLASQELSDYTTFTTRRIEMKTEFKKEAAKAHELEILEVGFSNMLEAARAKRDDLLKQLEEVENNIKAAEIAQADNAVEIEELISRIGDKSQKLRDMEKNHKSWQVKQAEAKKTLENVEQDWLKIKSLLQDL